MESKGHSSRIAEIEKSALPGRLLKGATNLGTTWRAGQRCLSDWSRICPCVAPTDFCQVKRKWIALAEEFYGAPPHGLSGNEPFYVIEAMTLSQFRATGLTALIELPGAAMPIRVGSRGTTWKTILDLAELQDDDAVLAVAVDAVLKLQKMGSK
jgi:hypothetical protein